MVQDLDIAISPRKANDPEEIKTTLARKLNLDQSEISHFQILRRSVDARRKPVLFHLRLRVFIGEQAPPYESQKFNYQDVSKSREVLIVGAGPAGLFAALRLIELGFRPVVLERGKPVSDRKADIAKLNRNEQIDPDSNFCFGEGGAGTFSDGKLYTRSKKRGDVQRILDVFIQHGASNDIGIDAHPHIGSDRLPAIVQNMRQTILDAGGWIEFHAKVNELVISNGALTGLRTERGDTFEAEAVILATGHSARDIYDLLHRSGIYIEAKGFAMGVRVEHPQILIDRLQYHHPAGRGDFLPPAEYNLSAQVSGRGVYSFCMCPGGHIVPAATDDKELVVNGMSNSGRTSRWANSGLVVEIREKDLEDYKSHGPLAGIAFQKSLEQLAFINGGNGQVAPAQRLTDFTAGKLSTSLPESSYHPGLISSPLHFWLPESISGRLKMGLIQFNKKMRGYLSKEALMVGVESRTSSPVRIPRGIDSMEHQGLKGLFPCGEGAGYAGGIASCAMDGEKCAEAVVRKFVG